MRLSDLKDWVNDIERRIDKDYKMENPEINILVMTPDGLYDVNIQRTELNPVDNIVSITLY